MTERGVWVPERSARADLAVFADRACRLDPAAVLRLRTRDADCFEVWVNTGLDVLAMRLVAGRVAPDDLCAGADAVAAGLAAAGPDGFGDPGWSMDSSWHAMLPPRSGFSHVEDLPAAAVIELGRRGSDAARDAGTPGAPASLLSQDVITVTGDDGEAIGVEMRAVFALTGMSFLPTDPAAVGADEIVRVRATPGWLRVDTRFGSVYRRRGDPNVVLH